MPGQRVDTDINNLSPEILHLANQAKSEEK